MTTIIVSQNTFYSHFPKRIPKGTVKAETVSLQLDKSWAGLTVFSHWRNLGTGVEKRSLLGDPDQAHEIPWEVLTDRGELRMGLVGMDGATTVKPTIWLTYGYVVDGVDPDAGEDPQQPTPSWQQQMVAQATQASQAAQEAQEYAKQAAESIKSAGPYAEEAKQSAEDAKASAEAARGAAQEAANARDQANTAATTAQGHAEAAGTAKDAAEQSASNTATAQDGAEQSAQAAAGFALAAEQAKQEAQKAAAALPTPTKEDVGKTPMVNELGEYELSEVSGASNDEWELVFEKTYTAKRTYHPVAIDFQNGTITLDSTEGIDTEFGQSDTKLRFSDTIACDLSMVPSEFLSKDFRTGQLSIKAIGDNKIEVGLNNVKIPSFSDTGKINLNAWMFDYGLDGGYTNVKNLPQRKHYKVEAYDTSCECGAGIDIQTGPKVFTNDNGYYIEDGSPFSLGENSIYPAVQLGTFLRMNLYAEIDVYDTYIEYWLKWKFFKRGEKGTRIYTDMHERHSVLLYDQGISSIAIRPGFALANRFGSGSNMKVWVSKE